ncbi:MAG: phosphoglycerate kinase [Candidatus Terrybacteria bacterium]|nr:phosphoglycerate kinase [Candidatus Terrybacteria bacterium]
MRLPSIKNINVKGKRILLRADFNVPMEKGKIVDDFRIQRTLPTINFLRKKGAKVIIISHLTDGRAKSLKPVAEYLSKRVGGEVILLENIRNYPGEEKNDKKFAKQLAKLGDIYVNDAFSVSHRNHASIVGIPKYLPSYTGFLFEEEYKNLKNTFKPKHPFLFILGGVKFGTKLPVLEKFMKIADKIYIGGALANNFFWVKKIDVGESLLDKKLFASRRIKKILRNPKIVLPIDVKKKNSVILDIGPLAIKELSLLIKEEKFILWNGPLGNFEEKGFEKGTMAAARAIAGSKAISVIGGGDTIAAIKKAKIPLKKFSFVSTAGGAMLEFLAHGTLPGIEALTQTRFRSKTF